MGVGNDTGFVDPGTGGVVEGAVAADACGWWRYGNTRVDMDKGIVWGQGLRGAAGRWAGPRGRNLLTKDWAEEHLKREWRAWGG